jgi:hypothetical protein
MVAYMLLADSTGSPVLASPYPRRFDNREGLGPRLDWWDWAERGIAWQRLA